MTTNEMMAGLGIKSFTRHAYPGDAVKAAESFKTPRMVVFGDGFGDGVEFWVVSPRDAAKLRKAGYETASPFDM